MSNINNGWERIPKIESYFLSFIISLYIFITMAFSNIEGMTIYTKIAWLGVMLSLILVTLQKKRLPIFPWPMYFILIWLFFAISGVFVAINAEIFFAKYLTVCSLLSVTLATTYLIFYTKNIKILWTAFFVSAVITGLYGLMNKGAMSTLDGRLYGTFGNSNLFGVVMMVAFLCGIYMLTTVSFAKKIFILLAQVFLFYLILESGSRKAIVCAVLFSSVLMLAYVYEELKINAAKAMLVLSLMFCIVLVGSIFVQQSPHFHRLQNMFNVLTDDNARLDGSMQGRKFLIEKGAEVAINNPIFGVGLDNFSLIEADEFFGTNVGTYAHNNYIEVAVSTGLVGVILFYSFHMAIIYGLFNKIKGRPKSEKMFIILNILLIMNLLILDLGVVSYYSKTFWLLISFTLPMVVYPSILMGPEYNKNSQVIINKRQPLY